MAAVAMWAMACGGPSPSVWTSASSEDDGERPGTGSDDGPSESGDSDAELDTGSDVHTSRGIATTGGRGSTSGSGTTTSPWSTTSGSGGKDTEVADDGTSGTSGGTTDTGDGASADETTGPVRESPPPLHGERYPFPQNIDYPYGVRSSEIDSDHVRRWYDDWSQKYLQACNDNLRPGVDPLSTSLVEAQGFAMIAAAYMGDKPVLDRLYGYYQAKLTQAGCGLMGWKNNCGGFEDQGSATDGDIDVASGLLVAHWQWPNDGYDEKARAVLSALKRVIVDCGGTLALHPGCSGGRPWGGCDETDASYYSPAFFRHFAELTGDDTWAKLADDTHVIRDAAAHPSTGLVPDWQSVGGRAGAGSRKGYYSFDAIRVPFKHGLDYLWHGNERARAWCEKISSWAHGVGVGNIRDGYYLDGGVEGRNHNLATVGSLAVCAMANTQEIADAFVAESVRLRDDFWYSGYLGNLYLLAISGNMWTPEIVGH